MSCGSARTPKGMNMDQFLCVLLSVTLVALGAEAAPHPNKTSTTGDNTIVPAPICEPRYVYIEWDKVRAHLVQVGQRNLPGSWEGPRLRVGRCLNFLNYCDSNSGYCGVSSQKEVTEKLPLTKNGRYIGYLKLSFAEDTGCSCMTGDEYNIRTNPAESIPPIYDVVIKKENGTNEIMKFNRH